MKQTIEHDIKNQLSTTETVKEQTFIALKLTLPPPIISYPFCLCLPLLCENKAVDKTAMNRRSINHTVSIIPHSLTEQPLL